MSEDISPRTRQDVFLAAGGKCVICGVDLEKGWHVDHIVSRVDGGSNEIENLRALCPEHNLRKGRRSERGLWLWQERALDRYTGSTSDDFLLVATPGAGKTRFAGEVLRNHFKAGAITRAIILVPTERLKVQWAKALHELGLDIEPRWQNSVGVWPGGMNGVAVTYAQVSANPGLLRKLTTDRQTFVVLDEIHHCGDSMGWGDAVRSAFTPAVKRLALSGTPFRSDNNEIPFVRYVDGKGEADFSYGYGEALADGIVRSVYFPAIGGMTEWSRSEGLTERRSFDEVLTEQGTDDRLRTAVSTEGWLKSSFQDANHKLQELRSSDPDAAGIIWAIDDYHLREVIAPLFKRVTGADLLLVTSHDPNADAKLDGFSSSGEAWIGSIKMVAEGIDIPRLRVGVYATTTTTELFFRQAVGRLVRLDEDGADAHFFIPDDPRLRDFAANIKEEREHVLEQEVELLEALADGERVPSTFVALGSSAEDRGVIFDGDRFGSDHLEWVKRILLHDPATAGMEPALVAKVLQNADRIPAPTVVVPPSEPEVVPAFERKKQLAGAVNRLVASVAYDVGLDHRELNKRLNRAVGCKTRKAASPEELESALRIIQEWKRNGEVPVW